MQTNLLIDYFIQECFSKLDDTELYLIQGLSINDF